jgi:hypothetical protein
MSWSVRVSLRHRTTLAVTLIVVAAVNLLAVDVAEPSAAPGIWRDDVVFPVGTSELTALVAIGPELLLLYEEELERELRAIAPAEIADELSDVRIIVTCAGLGSDDGRCPLATARAGAGWQGTIRISPVALNLTDEARRALLAHELAHLWQHELTGTQLEPVVSAHVLALPVDATVREDVVLRPIELEADCIAQLWGHPWPETAPYIGYWRCTDVALTAVRDVWLSWLMQR